MRTHDLAGREYARLSDLKAGDRIQLDDGFPCNPPWVERVVQVGSGLFFWCTGDEDWREGMLCCQQHGIESQAEDNGGDYCIGVYKL